MGRSKPEWIGKTDDTPIPRRIKLRILEKQDHKCAVLLISFGPNHPPKFDHIIALEDGGENRESNIQALSDLAHKPKTADEAAARADVRSKRAKHYGIKKPSKMLSRGFVSSKYRYSNARGYWIHADTKERAPDHIQERMA